MDTKALRQKILDLAIRGKLVPQDPTDEPASVLLERIRAQKQQMVKEGKLKAKDIKNDTVIFVGEDNLHYEKHADGTVKCIEDEIPFEVPEGWEWCRCRNVVELSSGQDLEPQRYNSNGAGIPYITGASNLSGGHVIINRWTETPTTHATINDLLLTCKGSGVGKMAICDIEDAHIARQIMALRCTSAICLSYLQVMMSAFITEITFQANGIIPGIRREIVLETLFPLPPYNEQIQIGDRCNALTDLVNAVDIDQTEMLSLVGSIKAKILDLAIRGQLIAQSPDDEPASVLLDHIRAEKEALIKQGKIKRDKRESVIFRGDDNSYYEKIGDEIVCIDDELPFAIPDGWTWCELQDCCIKEIKRGRSPKYAETGSVLSFAQKCNQKVGGINIGLALWIDDTSVDRYEATEYLRNNDIVINSTGTGTLGRVGIYHSSDNPNGTPIVPDSHVTVVRPSEHIHSAYIYCCLRAMQTSIENMGEGSTNQKELKPLTVQQLRIPIPPYSEQLEICDHVSAMMTTLSMIETELQG